MEEIKNTLEFEDKESDFFNYLVSIMEKYGHLLDWFGGIMYREGKKCVIYSRVSTEMQIDGYSLEGQKNSIRRFADREEMIIVDEYEDAGKSGKSIEGRPSFMKMLNDIKRD